MSSMFLHYLFLLLVAIHVTLACKCKPMTLLQAMCSSNTTVVLARVSDGQPHQVGSIPYRSYDIKVSRQLKEEANKTLVLDDKLGSLLFPAKVSDCGGILTDGLDYVIAGYVDRNGELVSNHCHYYVPYSYLTGDQNAMNILIGEGDCNNA
ncbi:hypothetical protein ACJMK2_034932 [Sinanodonta woodiana]|uniref:NTR domain-containing protein n=1 Tax=Sinanodonta woodiana TaxID=1069815 RepID=A0ABD3WT83_SINWO